jgi:DtxR family Mn-dependent transcriptional regulator
VSTSSHDRVELEREKLLRELWIEKKKARRSGEYNTKKDDVLLMELVRSGFLNSLENEIQRNTLTEEGERKGRELTRRHRIAERFFSDVFKIDESRVDVLARQFDYRLSFNMTENLCIFLEHPKTCPHGDPIPPGKCCQERIMVK